MAQLDNQTKVNVTTSYFGKGGASNLDASTLTLTAGNTSTILETYPGVGRLQTFVDGQFVGDIRFDSTILGVGGIVLEVGSGSNEVIFAGDYLLVPQLSSFQGLFSSIAATDIYAPAVSCQQLDIDGQVLTANPTELLLNGVPLITQSSLSTIADWSLDPAISSVNMAGFDLLSTTKGFFSSIYSDSAVFGDISTNTLTVQSTIHVISTISSSVLEAEVASISTLNVDNMSAASIFVSSINGSEFTSTGIIVEVAGVSSLVANSISSVGAELRQALVSSIQFKPEFDININFDLAPIGEGIKTGLTRAGVAVGAGLVAIGTGIVAAATMRNTTTTQTIYNNTSTFQLINTNTQLQVSSFPFAVSSVYRYVSSSGDPNLVPGQEVFMSTIIPAGVPVMRSVSDPLNMADPSTVTSTIQSFGEWVALPESGITSTISTFNELYTSSLAASTMVAQTGNTAVGVRGGAPYLNSASGVSTLEVFDTGAPQYSGALRANQINFSYAGLTSNDFTQDTLLYNQGGNRLTTGTGRVVAYLSDIPVAPGTVSSFSQLYTSSLNASSITMPVGSAITVASTFTDTITGFSGNVIRMPGQNLYLEFPGRIYSGEGNISTFTGVETTVSSLNGGIPYTTANPPPAAPTISTFNTASISSATISSVNGGIPYTTANPPPVTDSSTILVSSIGSIGNVSSITIVPNSIASFSIDTVGRFTEIGRNFNLQAQSTGTLLAEVLIDATGAGQQGVFRLAANGIGNLNASTVAMSTNQLQVPQISTNNVSVSSINLSQTGAYGLSSLMAVSTAQITGFGTSTCMYINTDVSLGQNDLFVQQLRVGYNNPTNAQSEIIFYDANGATRGFNSALQDRAIRYVSTVNGTTGGYLLDTSINPPFFSTINAGTSTALMAYFPSTTNSTIGVSTISVIPNPIFVAQTLSVSSQKVLAANTPLPLDLGAFDVNVGGYTVQASTLTVPVAGTYTFAPSIQFNTTSGGAQTVDFWFTKNGADVPNSASKLSVANNAQTIGTVVFQNTAAAGDQFGIKIASADSGMEAGFFQSTIAPYARPAIPSVILNAQRVA